MFCVKCGTQLPDDARFCSGCGNPVALGRGFEPQDTGQRQPVAPIAPTPVEKAAPSVGYERHSHPYHRLGGWLALIYYGQLLAVGLLALGFLMEWIPSLKYIRFIGREYVVAMLIQLAGYIACCYLCLKFAGMLKRKNPSFLRFYELTMIVLCAINIVTMLFSGAGFVPEAVRPILSAVLIFVVWTSYFRKSVRVRTYMGSDAYLKNSIFFKNSVAPAPADGRPYAQQQ